MTRFSDCCLFERGSGRWSADGFGLLLVALAGCILTGCTTAPAIPNSEVRASETPAPAPALTSPKPIAAPPETVRATIYSLDSMCAAYESEAVALPKERSLEAAVGKVLATQQSSDFDLSGYRVLRRAEGEVVIDLRLAPDSRRQMASLSSCEQRSIFGSLRETLLRNSQWGIKSIRFVHRGRAIVL